MTLAAYFYPRNTISLSSEQKARDKEDRDKDRQKSFRGGAAFGLYWTRSYRGMRESNSLVI